MSLLHVSATHGPSSGNIYYWGDHCTGHFVVCALRHIVVFVVNLFPRIYPSYLFWRLFQSCSSHSWDKQHVQKKVHTLRVTNVIYRFEIGYSSLYIFPMKTVRALKPALLSLDILKVTICIIPQSECTNWHVNAMWIRGPHTNDYEDCGLLTCNAMQFGWTYRLRIQDRRLSQSRTHQKLETSWARILLVSWMVYSSTVKMEAICSYETSGSPKTTWCYNLEYRTLQVNTTRNKAFRCKYQHGYR
jgi:hypothetical protein